MKRIALILNLIFIGVSSWAYDFEVDGIYYNITSTNTCSVTFEKYEDYKYKSNYAGDIVIPETVKYAGKELVVTSIGMDAFYNCAGLKSISLPNTITYIGVEAFYGCSGLFSFVMPNSVTDIGWDVFHLCSKLEKIVISNSLKIIPNNAFRYCQSLKSVDIPKSVVTIANNVFQYCNNLSKVTIPKSVTTIGNYVFQDCANLQDIFVSWDEPLSISSYSVFDSNNSGYILMTLHVPYGTKEKYQNKGPWKFFWSIEEDALPILTIKANDAKRQYGTENPKFTYKIEGFNNGDTEESLIKKPVLACIANKESLPGEYNIEISGAETDDYVIKYINGTLTVEKLPQEIIWNQNIPMLAPGGELYEISATASSGLDVSFSSSDDNVANLFYLNNKWYINPLENGTVDIIAKQDGNNIYESANTVKKTIVIDPSGIVETKFERQNNKIYYDIMGRKVLGDYNGVVIINGKKFLKK